MFLPKLLPAAGCGKLEDVREDFRESRRLEKYRLGEKALYIPAGFRWHYLPLREIGEYRPVTRLIESDNGVAPFSMEVPSVRIFFHGKNEVLELEKEKSVRSFLDALEDLGDD